MMTLDVTSRDMTVPGMGAWAKPLQAMTFRFARSAFIS